MARSVPLTEARALVLMENLRDSLWDSGVETGDRLASCLWGHKDAFRVLCESSPHLTDNVIALHRRKDIVAEFLPVIGPIIGFNSQCDDMYMQGLGVRSGWFDNEIGCDGNCESRFVVRKLPYISFRSLRRTRLIRLQQQLGADDISANVSVWDVLAVLRSHRRRLPRKCAICVLGHRSWFNPKYDRSDTSSPRPRSYMMFFLDGAAVTIRNVSENEFAPEQTLFLNYVASTVDLLA